MAQRKSKEIQQSFKISIRGKEWLIRLATQEEMRKLWEVVPVVGQAVAPDTWQDCYGCCFRSLRTICIDPTVLKTELLEEVIAHEIAHALLDPIAQIGSFHEEVICDVLGADMWGVMRQLTMLVPLTWLP